MPVDLVLEIRSLVRPADIMLDHGVRMTHVGRSVMCLCPFHADRNPSLLVGERNFKCFGCGARGDVIKLYSMLNGVSYSTACQTLKERLNLQDDDEEYNERCHFALMVSTKAMEWCEKNGFSLGLIRKFKVGLYDPRVPGSLKIGLQGHSRQFDGRLMLPLRDRGGRIVAYQGRTMHDVHPKYVSTHNHSNFERAAYIFDTRNYRHEDDRRLVLVEGPKDAMVASQHGLRGLATLGTQVGQEQMSAILQVLSSNRTKEAYVCLDDDDAGRIATKKLLKGISQQWGKVWVLPLRGYKDLAEMLMDDPRMLEVAQVAAVRPWVWLKENSSDFNVDSGQIQELTCRIDNPWLYQINHLSAMAFSKSSRLVRRYVGGTSSTRPASRLQEISLKFACLGMYMYERFLTCELHDRLVLYGLYMRLWKLYLVNFSHHA